MSETPINRLAALREDGFVDFYELLAVGPDATVTRIRTTINALYNEAQSNRDHRNLNRRREYQTLLQLLPQAREMLLDEKIRPRYDEFREEALRGAASITFEDWTRSLTEEANAKTGHSSVLGVHKDERNEGTHIATASVKKVGPKPVSRVVVEADNRSSSSSSARASLLGSLITVVIFFVLFVVLRRALHLDLSLALLISCVAAIVAWFVTHKKSPRRTSI